VLLIPLVLSGCKTDYTFQIICYPTFTKAHEKEWEYSAKIFVSSKSGQMTRRTTKKISIEVYDRTRQIFLEDNFELIGAQIIAKAAWEDFSYLTIQLFEEGNQFAAPNDDYNMMLIKNGPNILLEVRYQFDEKLQKFTRASSWEPPRIAPF
jgi:hypothetical protein